MLERTREHCKGFFKTLLFAFRIRNITEFRQKALVLAEVLDAYRIVPRMTLYAYGYLVAWVVNWYASLPRIPKIMCDSAVLERLKNSNLSVQQLQELACRTIDIIGPTSTETVLVTTVCGLAPLVLGLYFNSGRSWEKNPTTLPSNNNIPSIPSMPMHRSIPNVQPGPTINSDPIGPRDPEARG